MEGIVFDIQRGSLNDGPGIRTTIFLKGCSLNCHWCHNEESISTSPQLRFYAEKCTHCMNCVDVCPVHAHQNNEGIHAVDFTKCIRTWDCIGVCPHGALERTGEKMNTKQVVDIIRKDREYYKGSGGGVTISGGEPMVQYRFTRSILESAKAEFIHTCLDTSGYAEPSHFLEVIPFTDLILLDYKESDPELHRQFTGQTNEMIMKNLKHFEKEGCNVILRCPLVPDLNDRPDHFESIASIAKQYHSVKEIHILPYHSMGSGKAEQHGIVSKKMKYREPTAGEKLQWEEIMVSSGVLNFTIF
ncbi:MAG: glycyl-radical enzyme activating protein [Bacteroidales bacterium]|nr:glycyl-radical enzyme activating protein [Bacteroidales bacterium]